MKMPRWMERFLILNGLKAGTQAAKDMLAGVGKHARQRKHKKDHWERKRRLKKERKAAARKVYRVKKKKGKKPVRKKPVRANSKPRYRRKK